MMSSVYIEAAFMKQLFGHSFIWWLKYWLTEQQSSIFCPIWEDIQNSCSFVYCGEEKC